MASTPKSFSIQDLSGAQRSFSREAEAASASKSRSLKASGSR
jgi:hypothetical protein